MLNKIPPFPKSAKIESKPHLFCPGCGHPIALKNLGYVIDELKLAQKTVIGFDIGCSLLAWDYFNIDSLQTHHGRTVPIMSGLKLAKPENIAIAYQGDGGAYAIGLQSLLSSAHRNDKITVLVINNTVYAMTGGQMAPTTLEKEITDTTPSGRTFQGGKPFLGPETVAKVVKEDAFVARGSVDKPLALKDLIKKALEHQIENRGFSMVEILSFCPTNWKTNAAETLEFLEKMKKYYKTGIIKNSKQLTVNN